MKNTKCYVGTRHASVNIIGIRSATFGGENRSINHGLSEKEMYLLKLLITE